jgi:hypothetical protein
MRDPPQAELVQRCLPHIPGPGTQRTPRRVHEREPVIIAQPVQHGLENLVNRGRRVVAEVVQRGLDVLVSTRRIAGDDQRKLGVREERRPAQPACEALLFTNTDPSR